MDGAEERCRRHFFFLDRPLSFGGQSVILLSRCHWVQQLSAADKRLSRSPKIYFFFGHSSLSAQVLK
jgi:hypothetical protein